MLELTEELKRQLKNLNSVTGSLQSKGQAKALAEKEYRVALSKEILKLREGTQKTPSNVIADVARGSEEVAELKFNRDMYETIYDAAKETINTIKTNIRVLEKELEAIRNGK